jgi:LmbE family N-acetylglucosaminyl deacetylase
MQFQFQGIMVTRIRLPFLLLGTMISCTTAGGDLGSRGSHVSNPDLSSSWVGKVIVVALAHPDDESALGGALARLARETEVHLVIATDGRYGVTEHARIPAGDSLVAIRSDEARCSATQLGLADLHLLGAHDGLGMVNGIGEYFRQMRTLRNELRGILETLRPHMIITFGPDGDTGHADHRLISALVTELRLQGVPSSNPEILYLAWTQEQAALYPDFGLAHVAERYLDFQISFTQADEERALESIRCHQSQFSAGEIEQWLRIEREDTANTRYFRILHAESRVLMP